MPTPPLANLAAAVANKLSIQAAAAREKLCWQMIANGRLPSQGWNICDRIVLDGNTLRYECWAACTSPARCPQL